MTAASRVAFTFFVCALATASAAETPTAPQPTCGFPTSARPLEIQIPAPLLDGSAVCGDFDADGHADFATVYADGLPNRSHEYHIEIVFPGYATSFTVFSRAVGGLNVSARDLDGDHDLDFVITSKVAYEPVAVWKNDGHGAFFETDTQPLSRRSAQLFGSTNNAANQTIANDGFDGQAIKPENCAYVALTTSAPFTLNGLNRPTQNIRLLALQRAPPSSQD